jgi:hypothetical protein
MRRLSRAGLAIGVLLAGTLSAFTGAPVRAQTGSCDASAGDTSKIEGSITSPTTDAVEEKSLAVQVRGEGIRYIDRPAIIGGDVANIRRIEADLLACDAQKLPAGSARVQDFNGGDDPRTFVWDTPELVWNGRYAVRMTITADNNASRTIVQPFRMNLPASAPTGVKTVSDASGGVTVSWDPAPAKEPDTVGYIVEWTAASDDDFSEKLTAEVLPQNEADPPPTKFSHTPGAGEWQYRVIALRPGTKQQGFNPSKPSSTSTASVAPPPTTTAGGTVAGSGSASGSGSTGSAAGSGSTATTAKGGASRTAGTVDLSNFSRLLDQRRTATPEPRRAAEPDPGFQETLPFQPGDEPAVAAATDEVAGGEQEFAQEVISDDSERRQAMTFIAASLFFAVLGYGLRLVKREADRVDLEPTEPSVLTTSAEAVEPAPVDGEAPSESIDVTSEVPRPIDDAPLLRDDEIAAAAVPLPMAVPRRVAAADAPHLDVPLPPRRARRPRPDAVGTGNAGRAARRVSSGPRPDRGASGEVVRTRRRRTGSGDRRTPVG